jgi:hypothetical protein
VTLARRHSLPRRNLGAKAPKAEGTGPGDGTAGALDPAQGGATAEETILQRLVALNAERAAEERRGLIRWLRPEFQHPGGGAAVQAEAKIIAATPAASGPKPAWPKTLPEQFQALRAALAARPGPLSAADLAQGFTRAPRARSANSWRPSPPSATPAGWKMAATSRLANGCPTVMTPSREIHAMKLTHLVDL